MDNDAIIDRLKGLRDKLARSDDKNVSSLLAEPASARFMVNALIADITRTAEKPRVKLASPLPSASPSLADKIRAAEVVLVNTPESQIEVLAKIRAEALAFLMGIIR